MVVTKVVLVMLVAALHGGSRSVSRLTIQQRKENCEKMNIPIARDAYVSRALIRPLLSLLPLLSCGGGVLFATSMLLLLLMLLLSSVFG